MPDECLTTNETGQSNLNLPCTGLLQGAASDKAYLLGSIYPPPA